MASDAHVLDAVANPPEPTERKHEEPIGARKP
jgi:hypothetical protein